MQAKKFYLISLISSLIEKSLPDSKYVFSSWTVAKQNILTVLFAELPHERGPVSLEDKDSAACHVKNNWCQWCNHEDTLES